MIISVSLLHLLSSFYISRRRRVDFLFNFRDMWSVLHVLVGAAFLCSLLLQVHLNISQIAPGAVCECAHLPIVLPRRAR
jgi:hypothetical protein